MSAGEWTHDSWFARYPTLAQTPVFTLHVRLGVENGVEVGCTIRAYEGPACSRYGHTRLWCELTLGTRGAATRQGGNTDSEFFEWYTQEQLDFARTWGETLSYIAAERYGER